VATGRVPDNLVRAIVYPLLTAGIIGIGPADWWLCDLFANLRLHVMAGLLLTIPVIATGPQRFLLAACLITFCWGTFTMLRQSNGTSFPDLRGHPVLIYGTSTHDGLLANSELIQFLIIVLALPWPEVM